LALYAFNPNCTHWLNLAADLDTMRAIK